MHDIAGKRLGVLDHPSGGLVDSLRVSPDGMILTAGIDKSARLWDRHGRLVSVFPDGEYYVTVAEFCGDGKHIFTSGSTGKFWTYQGRSGGSVAVNPFKVEIIMAGDPDPKFTTIDHRNEPTTTGRQTPVNANGHGD